MFRAGQWKHLHILKVYIRELSCVPLQPFAMTWISPNLSFAIISCHRRYHRVVSKKECYLSVSRARRKELQPLSTNWLIWLMLMLMVMLRLIWLMLASKSTNETTGFIYECSRPCPNLIILTKHPLEFRFRTQKCENCLNSQVMGHMEYLGGGAERAKNWVDCNAEPRCICPHAAVCVPMNMISFSTILCCDYDIQDITTAQCTRCQLKVA